ncbi:Glucomannan 4-beta-mannosyltransferase 2 [Actinoplanes sp. SE50]|uniref:glycosyltransferase family A protein n=1 Tax=unclassified Actinoplanes TaxID=2626549 RepID=UPI00023EDE77|nr:MULTISPECIES: glycosyltransferase family A protein [unclassified Actinoplanes]AEV88181.1 Glucomannan 4-beta-mannosyltransferase 2 [Actinoplanes sp. SE50/110]ATO86586.1 Glucomannan 4-beta-mannosyltransferase 2 [Actinoplanes sp. SE50]SLM04003.1 Glucomannan 4-beta-mannosyltransferase 2 [Actinoplanes sp. SE50/110]
MIGSLLDEQPATLVAAAVRNRAVGLRDELAYAGLRGTGTLSQLLAAARAGRRDWLRERGWAVQPARLAMLAQIIALQDVLPGDRADALALFELLGPRAVPPRQRAVYAQLAGSARMRVDRQVRREIATDLANPFRHPGRSVRRWLRRFTEGLPEPAVRLDDRADLPPFDRLTTAAPAPIERPEKISVVVTAYRPDEGLLTAVRSIVRQSWRNLEILLVDDASGPGFDDVLRRAVALDPRVRLLRQNVNAGTYVARNAGLDAATGDFVTFQDSDDWSHPRRLELQVTPLLADPRLVACTSDGRRVTADLVVTRLGRRGGKLNPSALLLRRTPVLDRVGYLDVVRKGGDSEYIERIVAAFGPRAVRHLPIHLALIRLSGGSLSRAEILPYWIHPARAVYRSGYVAWHRRIAAGATPAHRPRDGANRPFPAPAHLLRSDRIHPSIAAYDVIVAADWRTLGESQRSALAEIDALLAARMRVAVLHLEDWRRPARERIPVHRTIQDRVNAGRLGQVALTDDAECGLLLIRQAELLRFPPAELLSPPSPPSASPTVPGGGLRPGRVLVLVDEEPSGAVRPVPVLGAEPLWCPQGPDLRAALTRLPLTDFDLPTVAVAQSLPGRSPSARPVVGAEITDRRQLALLDRLTGMDVRIRVADGVHLPRQPAGRLVYRTADLRSLDFLAQLDFYLDSVGSRRSVLDAVAMGCVVLTTVPGPVGLRCRPDRVAGAITQIVADPDRAAERLRQDRSTLRTAHDPALFVSRVAALLSATTSEPAPDISGAAASDPGTSGVVDPGAAASDPATSGVVDPGAAASDPATSGVVGAGAAASDAAGAPVLPAEAGAAVRNAP